MNSSKEKKLFEEIESTYILGYNSRLQTNDFHFLTSKISRQIF